MGARVSGCSGSADMVGTTTPVVPADKRQRGQGVPVNVECPEIR